MRGREMQAAVAALVFTLAMFFVAGLIAVTHIRFNARATLDAGSYALLMLGVSTIGILIVRREPRNVEAFSGQLRERIDLDVLADRLLVTVRETVRPRTASVWLAAVTIPERPSGTTEA